MRRRVFLLGVAGAAIGPRLSRAQPSRPVVGVLHGGSPAPYVHHLAALREALAQLGFVEGKNLAIEYRWAEGRNDRLAALAADLVERRVAVIAAMTFPAAVAAKAATATIPIVFDSGSDPVATGLVESLARPGRNLTGVSLFLTALEPKRLQVLHELVPEARVIGLLVNPNRTNAEAEIKDAQQAAGALSLQIEVVAAGSESELETGFAGLAGRQISALMVASDALFNSRRGQLIALAARYAVPTIYFDGAFAAAGGLASYGTSIVASYRLVAAYVGKILAGAKPADLPVQQPTTFELIVNLKTAKALGLAVPPSILARADEVIE